MRLARVRDIQFGLAAAVHGQAERQVELLEGSAVRLASLRDGFAAEAGATSGSVLASLGELAMRLELAREGLRNSIAGARGNAERCKEARDAARRDQESADRLTEKATTEARRRAERKQAEQFRPRKRAVQEAQ
jgi:hypothetical protein